MATKIVAVDIAKRIEPIGPTGEYRQVMLFVTAKGEPLGNVWLDSRHSSIPEDEIRYEIAMGLPSSALARVAAMLPIASDAAGVVHDEEPYTPPVSIIIGTCNRPHELRRCLETLLKLDYSDFEIIVVSNNPDDAETAEVAHSLPVIYAEESRRGSSYARNTAVGLARNEIVVCTDDDVVPDSNWLKRLVQPFADSSVMCVTGLVVPMELESEAQELYEEYGGLGRGFRRKFYDASFFRQTRLRAVPTWHLGGTANAAFRLSGLRQIGGFDVTLGAGVPTGVGEDTFAFYQLLRLGHKIVYEPRAYVRHMHRRTYAELRKQIFDYSRGHYAYHLRCFVDNRDCRALFHMLVSVPISHARRIYRSFVGRSRYPVKLILWEIWGNVLGPLSLLRATARARRLERKEVVEGLVSYEIEH